VSVLLFPSSLFPSALDSGVDELSAGAEVLSAGAVVLSAGAVVLSAGAVVLSAGAVELSSAGEDSSDATGVEDSANADTAKRENIRATVSIATRKLTLVFFTFMFSYLSELLCLFVESVLAAELAELIHFKSVRVVFLVLFCVVVALLALCAGKSNLDSVFFFSHVGTSYLILFDRKIPLSALAKASDSDPCTSLRSKTVPAPISRLAQNGYAKKSLLAEVTQLYHYSLRLSIVFSKKVNFALFDGFPSFFSLKIGGLFC